MSLLERRRTDCAACQISQVPCPQAEDGMSRWLSGRTTIITGTGRITWVVGRINRVKRRHGTSTIQGMRSPIQKLAIGALILFFAPIWSPTIASTLADSHGGQVPGLSTD